MFRDDFKAEVDYLIQLCDELGEREPTLAPILGRGADPSVTRLVEGLAFSFGRLRQRLDDDLPEVIHPVIDNLCPEMLRPIPCGTIIALTPSPKMLVRQTIAAGASFAARPTDGTSCQFRSIVECEVSPCALRTVDIANDRLSIKLGIEMFGASELGASLPASLRLFLAHPVAAAIEARAFLLRNVTRVVVRAAETDKKIVLAPPVAASIDTRPAGPTSLPIATAFLALRDYFVFPQRYAFVTVPGFDAVAELGTARRLEISFELGEAVPKGILFDPSTVVLHAVPALNVFRPAKLSLPLGADKRRCSVRLEGEHADAEVYSVESVALVSRGLRTTPVEPWARFFPPRLENGVTEVRYEVHRMPSVLGPRLDVSLSFTAESSRRFMSDKVAAEVEVLATNGEQAAGLGIGDVCLTTATSPSLVTFANVTPVTRNAAPPLADDRLWRFFQLTKANLAALTDTETLASAIALANVAALDQWADAKAGVERFAGIVRVERWRGTTSDHDELRAGAVIRVTLDARRFSGPGDIQLFGEVLVPLLAGSINTSEWIELTLVAADGRPLARYPRAQGARRGL